MTPEQLFLRYAFPCVDAREMMCLVSAKHAEELKRWAMNGDQPTRRRLKFCFPNAFKALRELSLRNGCEIWSLENVRDYWHNNHQHQNSCPVKLVTADTVNGKAIKSDGVPYLNIYSLSIVPADKVWTHKQCIIELHEQNI